MQAVWSCLRKNPDSTGAERKKTQLAICAWLVDQTTDAAKFRTFSPSAADNAGVKIYQNNCQRHCVFSLSFFLSFPKTVRSRYSARSAECMKASNYKEKMPQNIQNVELNTDFTNVDPSYL